MILSWSHKLFFKVNAYVGRLVWLDKIMFVSAHWLIFLLALYVLSIEYFFVFSRDVSRVVRENIFVIIVLLIGLAISYGIACIWKHKRPFVEFPETKTMFRPKTWWKSFPSDHAFISFLCVFSLFLFAGFTWFSVIAFVLAGFVASGRVYAGVHYPRDIVGGFVLAVCMILLLFYVF